MKTRMFAMCISSAVALAANSSMAAVSAWWAPYTTDANTIGLWHFDDVTGPTGSFVDSSANANNGTLTVNGGSSVTLTSPTASGAGTGPGAGLFGQSLLYTPSVLPLPGDGNTPYTWGTAPNGSGQFASSAADFTVEAWIKPSADDLGANQEHYFLGDRSANGGWNLGIYDNKVLAEFMLTDTSNNTAFYYYKQGTATFSADTWYHVAITGDQTSATTLDISIYVNGVLDGQLLNGGGVAFRQSTNPLNLGNRGTPTAYSLWQGQIDEVRYSNVAREFSAAPIPEPASLTLLGLGGLYFLRRRHA